MFNSKEEPLEFLENVINDLDTLMEYDIEGNFFTFDIEGLVNEIQAIAIELNEEIEGDEE